MLKSGMRWGSRGVAWCASIAACLAAFSSCADEGSLIAGQASGRDAEAEVAGDATTTASDATPATDARRDAIPAFDASDAAYPQSGPDASGICTGCSVTQLALGASHSCALMSTGVVACWGENSLGQLGDGNGGGPQCSPVRTCGARYSSYPVRVSGLTDAVAIGAGTFHTCAIRATGQILCWGLTEGPSGWTKVTPTPVAVAGIGDAVNVGGGVGHNCIARASGKITCHGASNYGKLGAPSIDLPPTVTGVAGAVQVVGGRDHSCARLGGGAVQCWGNNGNGGLGDGLGGAGGTTAVAVMGLTDAIHISATAAYGDGEANTCAARSTGEVACWGKGGCVGANPLAPVQIGGIADAIEVAARRKGGCARLSTGEVSCWGPAGWGACPAQIMAGLTGVTHLAASAVHFCALRSSGEVMCWGPNSSSQLGDGTFTTSATPVQVVGLPP